MGIFKEGFLVRFFLVALVGFTVAIVASAKAAEGVDQLGGCSSASEVVSLADGSTVALASTDDCGATSLQHRLLLKLTPSGALDTAFGNGGISILPELPDPIVIDLMVQPDGKLLLVTGTAIARFGADGSLDPGYGGDGIIPIALPGTDPIVNATEIDDQGRLLIAGTAFEDQMGQPVIRRFLDDGTPDGSFGTGGSVQTDLFFGDPVLGKSMLAKGVGASADGSVYVAGKIDNRQNPGHTFLPGGGPGFIRYSPTGDFDSSYGTDGFAIVSDSNYPTVKAVRVDDSGTATLAGQSFQQPYGCYQLQLYRFDAGGSASTGPGGYMTCGSNATEIVGDGAAIASTSEYGGHGYPTPPPYEFELNRIGDLGNGMNPGITDTFIGFGFSAGFDVAAGEDGSITVVGSTPTDCSSEVKPCGRVIVLARYRGQSGGLDPAFGDQGVVLLPGITCPVRTYSDGPEGSEDRNRCLGNPNLERPEVTGRLTAPGSRTPGMVLKVKLPNNFDLFPHSNRKLTVTLPRALKIKPSAHKCIRAAQLASLDSVYSKIWSKRVNGPRSVTFSSGPVGFPNGRRRMIVRFGCGALREIPKKYRGKKLPVRVRIRGYSELYGAKTSQATIALKVPSRS